MKSAALAAAIVGVALSTTPGRAAQIREPQALDTSEPVPYFIADGIGRTGYRPGDRELAGWALAAWQRHAASALGLVAAAESTAIVRLYWANPREGQYGEMRPLIVGSRNGAAVYIRPDMDGLGPEIAQRAATDDLLRDSIVYLTCLHELGHALGLSHTASFDDIMYFFGYGGDIVEYFGRYRRQLRSRADIARISGLSNGDIKRLHALYPLR
jgi:Matrixin